MFIHDTSCSWGYDCIGLSPVADLIQIYTDLYAYGYAAPFNTIAQSQQQDHLTIILPALTFQTGIQIMNSSNSRAVVSLWMSQKIFKKERFNST